MSISGPFEVVLRRRLAIYRGISLVLFILVAYLAYSRYLHGRDGAPRESTPHGIDMNSPHASEVKAIIDPLRYSFVDTLMNPKVRLILDFEHGLWRLTNIHDFDSEGRPILGSGKSGICGDLAGYTYEQIKPIFESRYKVRFVRAAEANFFPAPLNTHYVISIEDTSNPAPNRFYILDPSFHRYGPVDHFDDYLFFEFLPGLQFMQRKDTDNTDIVNRAVPMLIQGSVKLSLMVATENGKFDAKNYSLQILETHRNQYMPKVAFKVSLHEGKKVITENTALAESLKSSEEYRILCRRVEELFDGIGKPLSH